MTTNRAPVQLSYLVSRVDDLLALEVEELAGVLLIHLNSFGANSGDTVIQHNKLSLHNFLSLHEHSSEYSGRQPEVIHALMEAWNWLQSGGFLIADRQPGWFLLSRRARRLQSREDFTAYRQANLLPKSQLHPLIAAKVYPAFLRGEYDTAVFQAFREVEVSVRRAGIFKPTDLGTALMREAFRPVDPGNPTVRPGPLTDLTLPLGEQKAMADLFSGAIGLYKNPQSHRNVPTEAVDAAEVILFASQLLRIVDRLAPPTAS